MRQSLRLLHVVGARPNYMKIAPVMEELARHPGEFEQFLLHTGQHYDARMSDVFFEDLRLPKPDFHLGVGSGTHARQTAEIMLRVEPVVEDLKPDWVVLVGDVNSTIAVALVCAKLGIRVAHIEAGLRSFDRTMPEEINRVLTDQLSDVLFTTCEDANVNLVREGVHAERIQFVGNVMIDCVVRCLPEALRRWRERLVTDEPYVFVTLHRPGNVDNPKTLGRIMDALRRVAVETPVVFPVHPRTRQRLASLPGGAHSEGITFCDPLGYLDCLAMQRHARLVITDSGGIQEETTYLGVPCLTLRPNTERPVTITDGTNQLVTDAGLLRDAARARLESPAGSPARRPALWDGRTASRIVSWFRQRDSGEMHVERWREAAAAAATAL